MARRTSLRVLQIFLTILGAVAVVAGTGTVLFGVRSILGAEAVTPTVDSEMRFYAVWYAAAGGIILWAARRVESETTTIRGVAGLFFVAACSRVLSWIVVGRPHPFTVTLMIIEFALPLIIIPWQAAVGRERREGIRSIGAG